jgi:threonine 3-dehydrogenase
MNYGGAVALLGVPSADVTIDWNQVIFKGLRLKGIYGREMFETWYKMAGLLTSGLDLAPIITHRFSKESFADGFALMGEGKCGKVVLDWA